MHNLKKSTNNIFAFFLSSQMSLQFFHQLYSWYLSSSWLNSLANPINKKKKGEIQDCCRISTAAFNIYVSEQWWLEKAHSATLFLLNPLIIFLKKLEIAFSCNNITNLNAVIIKNSL